MVLKSTPCHTADTYHYSPNRFTSAFCCVLTPLTTHEKAVCLCLCVHSSLFLLVFFFVGFEHEPSFNSLYSCLSVQSFQNFSSGHMINILFTSLGQVFLRCAFLLSCELIVHTLQLQSCSTAKAFSAFSSYLADLFFLAFGLEGVENVSSLQVSPVCPAGLRCWLGSSCPQAGRWTEAGGTSRPVQSLSAVIGRLSLVSWCPASPPVCLSVRPWCYTCDSECASRRLFRSLLLCSREFLRCPFVGSVPFLRRLASFRVHRYRLLLGSVVPWPPVGLLLCFGVDRCNATSNAPAAASSSCLMMSARKDACPASFASVGGGRVSRHR